MFFSFFKHFLNDERKNSYEIKHKKTTFLINNNKLMTPPFFVAWLVYFYIYLFPIFNKINHVTFFTHITTPSLF
jgi:hypothetical protein